MTDSSIDEKGRLSFNQFLSSTMGMIDMESSERSEHNSDKYVDMDAMQWMQEILENTLEPARSPRRTPLLQRADTPVMSNSSSKKAHYKIEHSKGSVSQGERGDDASDEIVIEPVKTPVRRVFRPASASRASSTASSSVTSAKYPSTSALSQGAFRKYHDALWAYRRQRQSLDRRLELEREEQQLVGTESLSLQAIAGISSTSTTLAQQECIAEVAFCNALCHINYSFTLTDCSSIEEGYFWSLLSVLRKLGTESLVMPDGTAALTQYDSVEDYFVKDKARQISETSKKVLADITPSSSSSSHIPLTLKRKYIIMKWIQSCLEQESKSKEQPFLPTGIGIPSQGHPDDLSVASTVSDNDNSHLNKMLQTCLSRILEGRMSDACSVAKSSGQSLKASLWVGGEPYDYKVREDEIMSTENRKILVGNPNRFLWKRQVWKTARQLHQQDQSMVGTSPGYLEEEAAIFSLLSGDVTNALTMSSIRTSWTKSLCVVLTGVWSRIEDEVLHRHNANRRRNAKLPFPGCQHEQEELEQLRDTSQLAYMKGKQIEMMLRTNPFLQQPKFQGKTQFPYKSAILSFIVGRTAVLEFCTNETGQVLSDITHAEQSDDDDVYWDQDWDGVRFLTHLTLFLDSLQVSTTPIILEGITSLKDQILMKFSKYIESRPDLWHFLALYISFLPEPKVLDYYPGVLVQVLDGSTRKLMLRQIRELMPDLELPILRRVVRLYLSAPVPFDYAGDETPDVIRCNSLQWLLQSEEHLGDSLICSNILLRDLLLDEHEDKMDIATEFVESYFPQDVIMRAGQTLPPGMDMSSQSDYVAKVNNAHSEHLAYLAYFDAYKTFARWKDIMKDTPISVENVEFVDTSTLNASERQIASQAFQRNWLAEKKKHFDSLLENAEAARGSIHKVLTHPGGWLTTDNDETEMKLLDHEEQIRRQETNKIRSRYLVLAVSLFIEVCEDTASWISCSLDDSERVGLTREEFLQLLITSIAGDVSCSTYVPDYWYQQALDLLNLVAKDDYGVHQAFSSVDLKDLLSKLAEISVSKLMNA